MEGAAAAQRSENTSAVWISERDLSTSIIAVVGALTGKVSSDSSAKGVKMSEDVLYASLVYQELRERSPTSGQQFLDQLKGRFKRRSEANNAQALSRAVQEVARNVGAKQGMQSSAVETLLRECFGHAQLDKTSSGLSRRARFTGIDSIEDRINANKTATERQFDRFAETIREKPTTSASNAKSLRRELDKIAASLEAKSSGGSSQGGGTGSVNGGTTPESGPKGETENDGAPEKPEGTTSPYSGGVGEALNVFKPRSEMNGKPVFILNGDEGEAASSVALYSANDRLVESFRCSGRGDDGRWYFRGEKDATTLDRGCYMQVTLRDGSHRWYVIPDPREYFTV